MKFKSISSLLLIIVFITACENNSTKNTSEKQTTKVIEEKKEPTKPEETEIWKPVPPKINFNELGVPSDAIVLFDGTNFNEWISSRDSTDVKWNLNDDGSMTVKDKTGDIQTKRNFGSVQLHIEWRSDPNNTQTNQNKSNSGVFLQNRYEVQVLDNNNNPTYVNGQVASIYKQSIPLAMASVETGKWNSYDIIFHAPQFNKDGKKTKSGTITVLHNGVLVQDHFEIEGTTEYIGWPKNKAHGKAPIKLQDHQDNSGVSYRNIWLRELE
ncbi:3-keto-disaccharide hydrolase [Tenacibaculum xiamenense]|uniref:3-keto-disaccharide hydrolase n=1 Tax=Tenacibaculum xiamenense TaxID=1261553 RepID=UPI0038954616